MLKHESGKHNLNFSNLKIGWVMRSCVALWLFSAMLLTSAVAQQASTSGTERTFTTKTINVWPGVAPGSEQWKQPEATLAHTSTCTTVRSS